MIRLYFAPGTCALGIHVLLEEAGLPYEARPVSFRDGEQLRPEFRAINPKGKVPTLVRPDGVVLTEWGTIATWIALAHPESRLLPDDLDGRIRVQEFLEYIIGTVHMRGFTLVAKPDKFSPDPTAYDAIRAAGHDVMRSGFAFISDVLGEKSWVFGDFTIADGALFYLTFWATGSRYEMPEALRAFHARMLERPAVRRALLAEGLSS